MICSLFSYIFLWFIITFDHKQKFPKSPLVTTGRVLMMTIISQKWHLGEIPSHCSELCRHQWHRPFHPPSLILCVVSLDSFSCTTKGQSLLAHSMGITKPWWKFSLLGIGSNFWKFYLIRIGFTLDELISLVKVFRLFKLERVFWCSECGHSR